MTTHAVIVAGSERSIDDRLDRLFDFFGVSRDWLTPPQLLAGGVDTDDKARRVVFASLNSLAELGTDGWRSVARNASAIYLFANESAVDDRPLRYLGGEFTGTSLVPAPVRICSMAVASDLGQLDGPMSGITVSARPRAEDWTIRDDRPSFFNTLLSIDGSPAFVQFAHDGVPVFFCASAALIDIDRPVSGPFFDVKEYFCSIVPLIMFMRWAFGDSMWRPLENGACLIIDDPLLKPRYGYCDFGRLLELMKVHGFTTNVAFIPWNWRRTAQSAAEFFRREQRHYSISVHGCDHTASEFGDISIKGLESKAGLAQIRMERHKQRTGIEHDAVMVFPQGVFSSLAPRVLKAAGFAAAVNSEVHPVDAGVGPTRIRDVWDVAIRRYGSFPIFTRRYPFHGVENFAFDTLIGKPCLIVSHHDLFRNGYDELLELLRQLRALRCSLTWRSLGDVVQRAGRRRIAGADVDEVEMYGNRIVVTNVSSRPRTFVVRKKEDDPSLVGRVTDARGDLEWTVRDEHVCFTETLGAGEEMCLAIDYKTRAISLPRDRTLRFKASVAARRVLCEFRDEYLQKLIRSAS